MGTAAFEPCPNARYGEEPAGGSPAGEDGHRESSGDIRGDPERTLFLLSQELGITDTLSDLSKITQQGAKQSVAIQQMYRPIDLNAYKRIETPFEGTASFRDETDPLKQFRSVENAYSNFQDMLQQAQSKRKELNTQIAALNDQLKNAQDDAEVQKLHGSLTTAQTSLKDLDGIMDRAEPR